MSATGSAQEAVLPNGSRLQCNNHEPFQSPSSYLQTLHHGAQACSAVALLLCGASGSLCAAASRSRRCYGLAESSIPLPAHV